MIGIKGFLHIKCLKLLYHFEVSYIDLYIYIALGICSHNVHELHSLDFPETVRFNRKMITFPTCI
jgi:hypothetical protein